MIEQYNNLVDKANKELKTDFKHIGEWMLTNECIKTQLHNQMEIMKALLKKKRK